LRNTVVKTWVTWLGTVTHGDGVFGRRGEQALGEMGWKFSNYELSFDNPLSSGVSAGHTVSEFKNVSPNNLPRIHVPVVIELCLLDSVDHISDSLDIPGLSWRDLLYTVSIPSDVVAGLDSFHSIGPICSVRRHLAYYQFEWKT
jgi:hypothetical protein